MNYNTGLSIHFRSSTRDLETTNSEDCLYVKYEPRGDIPIELSCFDFVADKKLLSERRSKKIKCMLPNCYFLRIINHDI